MRGIVLTISDGYGLISGQDGNRYRFSLSQWNGNIAPTQGLEIDFVIDGDEAKEIIPLCVPRWGRLVLLLLAWFLGLFGIHRFFVGKWGTGTIMLVLTLSMVGLFISCIWWLVDVILIASGNFSDKQGRKITVW